MQPSIQPTTSPPPWRPNEYKTEPVQMREMPNESLNAGSAQKADHFHRRAAFALIIIGTLLHLAYSTHLELVGDEAYYWLWSRHPDISYLDKGPMVAWFISAGTAFFGQTVFGVRFFAVLLAGGTGVGLYSLGAALFSARAGFWAVLMASVIPLFAVGASLMTIDTVYVFFWTWAAWAFWKANHEPGLRWWLLTGCLVGLGILSKYTAAMELVSFALFCCWHRPARVHFRRPDFWAMIGVALLFLLPAAIWNIRHGWPTSHWLVTRGGLEHRFTLHPLSVVEFFGSQAGVVSPLLFVGLLFLLSRRSLLQTDRPATRYTLTLFLPLFSFYFVLSANYHEPPNWTAAAYIGGLILLAAKWPLLMATSRKARWLAAVAVVLAMLETGLLLGGHWLHLPARLDPLNRARGSQALAQALAKVQQKTGASFIIAEDYMTASLLSFYLPGQPETFVPIVFPPMDQLEVWPNYEEEHPTGNALFMSKRNKVSESFHARFAQITSLGEIEVKDYGRVIRRYKIYLCRRGIIDPAQEQPAQ
ncbi:MAG: glycosyltransferase family 39 protein [Chthoniobacterales bacterium]|nr:glycosyltransferase family 39 protein [Chthoniobacterales bacterium]